MGRYGNVEESGPATAEGGQVQNKPMRAGQFAPNAAALAFVQQAMNLLAGTEGEDPVWDDAVAKTKPKLILDELEKLGWTRYEDAYGDHVYVTMPFPASNPPRDTDELRINVVLTKGKLMLDIRPWGWYEASSGGKRYGR